MYVPCMPSFNSCAFGFGSFVAPPPPPPMLCCLPPFGMLTCSPHSSFAMGNAIESSLFAHPTNSMFYGSSSNPFSSGMNYNYNLSYVNPFGYNNFFVNPMPYIPTPNFSYKFYDITPVPTYTPQIPLFSYNGVSSSTSVCALNTKDNASWRSLGYNSSAGARLSNYALNNSVGFTGYCAKYVKNAIAATGLGSYVNGDAWEMTSILRRNRNFREISPRGIDVNNLPAGCIVIYDRNTNGFGQYGHVEIATGDGRGVSDGITRRLKRNPSAIFIPVAA